MKRASFAVESIFGRQIVGLLLALCPVFAAPTFGSAQPDSDPEDLGIVSDTEWESPQFATAVSWSGNWAPLFDGNTYSDLENEVDGLALLGDHGTYIAVALEIRDETIESYRDFILSFREEANADFDFELIESGDTEDTSYFAYTATQDGQQFTDIIEVFYLSDDLIGYSELLGWTYNVPVLFEEIQTEIELEGESPFGYYYTEDNIPVDPDAVDPGADEPEPESISGLIDEHSYEGPQFGAEVTWDEPWIADTESTFSQASSETEVLALDTSNASFFIIFAANPGDSPADALENRYAQIEDVGAFDDLEIIDEGTEGDITYLAATGDQENVTAMIVLEASWLDEEESVMQVVELTAWIEGIEAEFESAQEAVEINGDEPFKYFPSEPMTDEIAA